jgi:hypothetical protein
VEHDHELDLETKSHSLAGMCTETVAESPPLCVVKCYTRIFLASRHLSNKQQLNVSIYTRVGVPRLVGLRLFTLVVYR